MGSRCTTDPQALISAFRQALAAAHDFEGATAPNPPVGCAVLDAQGKVLAVAAHRRAGTGHAEAEAIAECRALGCLDLIHTFVVTLEPCTHFGRTPPCCEAILATPARTVLIGANDPNPQVAGGGVEKLRAAGLDVGAVDDLDHQDAALLSAQAHRLIAPFAKKMRTGLPWITVKQALDANGSMIPRAGQKTFTSPASLTLAHRLRRRADAILTGSGTILADAPLFTVRHVPDFPHKSRYLVILDTRRRVSHDYLDAARDRGFQISISASLNEALRQLGEDGALEVLVEAGPQVTASVLRSGLWDEHFRITAGKDGKDHVEAIARDPLLSTLGAFPPFYETHQLP